MSLPPEVQRAREEAPDFGDVLGRARAKIQKKEYDPDLHHPEAAYRTPEMEIPAGERAELRGLLEKARTMPDRPGVRRVASL